MQLIDDFNLEALYFDVIDNAMYIMHDDGSVNIIDSLGSGVMTTEVLSPVSALKVLKHYRPFKLDWIRVNICC